jgi:DNA polymerase IV
MMEPRFRLVGVGVSTLCAAGGTDFAEFIDRRAAEAEQAIDRLREKFGNQVVIKGLALEPEDGEQTPEDG